MVWITCEKDKWPSEKQYLDPPVPIVVLEPDSLRPRDDARPAVRRRLAVVRVVVGGTLRDAPPLRGLAAHLDSRREVVGPQDRRLLLLGEVGHDARGVPRRALVARLRPGDDVIGLPLEVVEGGVHADPVERGDVRPLLTGGHGHGPIGRGVTEGAGEDDDVGVLGHELGPGGVGLGTAPRLVLEVDVDDVPGVAQVVEARRRDVLGIVEVGLELASEAEELHGRDLGRLGGDHAAPVRDREDQVMLVDLVGGRLGAALVEEVGLVRVLVGDDLVAVEVLDGEEVGGLVGDPFAREVVRVGVVVFGGADRRGL